jgi:hypothetical protein
MTEHNDTLKFMKRFRYAGALLTTTLMLTSVYNSLAQNKEFYNTGIMNGLSNQGQTLNKPYLSAGDRTYIVGTQDGNFPDIGSHVKGEMGGLWLSPIKLLDGFWVKLTDTDSGSSTWLKDAKEFINYPYGNKFLYSPALDGIQSERMQFCPQGKEGMVIKYIFKNTSGKSRKMNLEFVVKTDVSPVWYSKENNIIDAADTITWDAKRSAYVSRDVKNPWFAVWGSSIQAISHTQNVPAPVQTIGMGRTAAQPKYHSSICSNRF